MQLIRAVLFALSTATFLNRRDETVLAEPVPEEHAEGKQKQLSLVSAYLDSSMTKSELYAAVNKEAASMHWKDAVHGIANKLPASITGMLEEGSSAKAAPSFDEAALDKARETLNGMIETAQDEYDLKDMECKAFKERNRGEFKQTTADLSRLGSNIADDNALILDSKKDISAAQDMMSEQRKLRKANKRECRATKYSNQAQLRVILADLKIAEFIVSMTECKPGDDFLQTNKTVMDVEACAMTDGSTALNFKDPKLAEQASQIMSEQGKKALQGALLASHTGLDSDELQVEPGQQVFAALTKKSRVNQRMLQEPVLDANGGVCEWQCYLDRYVDLSNAFGATNTAAAANHWETYGKKEERDCTCAIGANGEKCNWQCYLDRYPDLVNAFGATNTAAAANHWTEHGKGEERDCTCVPEVPATLSDIMNPTTPPVVTEPETEPSKEKAQSKCVLGKADCGLLNDNMALMWGDIKDAKDELKSIMADNEAHCKSVRDMHNAEISTWQGVSAQKNVELSEGTGSLNTNTEEQAESMAAKTDLEKEYTKVWGECKETLHEILFTNICGTKTVRGEISKFSTEYGPTSILDCEVGDWVGEECSVECIDQVLCDGAKPGELPDPSCEGGVQNMTRNIVQNKTLGANCPALILEKGCNVIPCPIDCVQTEWSTFSKCSKECGGGVQQSSRNIVTRADNGGEQCEAGSDTRSCEEQSCDVDCVIADWTPWGPCSRACATGTQERQRKEISPKRAFGKCAHPQSEERYEKQTCNEFNCPPTPICIAQQDVIFAIDVSGSLRQTGFDTVSKFVKDMVSLYTLGESETSVGLLEYSKTGRIVSPLTMDSATLETNLATLDFQRGITDMAQGFSLAKTILMEGRKEASSMVIMLTDAKPSFRFSTEKAAKDLRAAGVRLVMVPIFEYGDKDFMKELASEPSEDNVLAIEGLDHLAANSMAEAIKLMTATCAVLEPEKIAVAEDAETVLTHVFMKKAPKPQHVRRADYDHTRDDEQDDDEELEAWSDQ